MLGKLIVTGRDREGAIAMAASALTRFDIAGIATTVDFHADLVRRPEFARAEIHTRWVEEQLQTAAH
jgi:acetyl-CoA carboxylase biotin carboxylase subunit